MLGMIFGICILFIMFNMFVKKCLKFEKVNGVLVMWFLWVYVYDLYLLIKMYLLKCK